MNFPVWTEANTVTVTLPTVVHHIEDTTYTSDPDAAEPFEDTCTCGHELADGDLIRWRAGRPQHMACYAREVEAMTVPSAWCAIAEDIKRNPSRHSAATVRAVLENLSALVSASAAVPPTTGETP